METFQFGCGKGCVPRYIENMLVEIAAEHGASFINAKMPEGWRYWFQAENNGQPFDGQLERAVIGEAERLGFWPPRIVKGT